MIASLHYYNSYDNFINRKKREQKTSPAKLYKNQTKPLKNSDFTYFLNKSSNDSVKTYIYELSSNFNGLKNIANNMYEKLYYDLPSENIEDNLKNFTSIYNRFIGFLEENIGNSNSFKKMSNSIKDLMQKNKDTLKDLGINISKNDFLSLKNEQETAVSSNIDVDKTKTFCLDLYKNVCKFMEHPMTNYMEFKDFSYYYTYSGDYDKTKSFKVIEQGNLIDISV